jgi:aminoglycoside 3-N-acetyltransferase
MLTCDEAAAGFRALGLPAGSPVLAHASLKACGQVEGGAATVAQAMAAAWGAVMMPVFTYKTMLIPEAGPRGNGLEYGSRHSQNKMAEFWHPGMPADPMMGAIPEALRNLPGAQRSAHPILSFAGLGVAQHLGRQTLHEPFAPIGSLLDAGGWVVLIGVDHTVNTSLHYAERLAGGKLFTRWALTPEGVVEVSGFPGCSNGFDGFTEHLAGICRRGRVGAARLLAFPLREMIEIAAALLRADPGGYLCDSLDCGRCRAARRAL